MAAPAEPRTPSKSVKQLREQFAELTSLFRYAPVGLAMLDRELRYVHINEKLAALNSLSVEEHLGRRIHDIIPEYVDEVSNAWRQVRDTGQAVVDLETKGGGNRDYLVSYFPVRLDDGTLAGVGVLVRDITRRKEMERAVRASEHRFRTILENAPIMVDSFDREGRCVLWNRECEQTLGWTLRDLQASDDPLSLCFKDASERDEVRANIMRADGRFREYRVATKDGSVREQLWADFKLPNGELISVGIDITERKEAQRELRKAHAELERRVEERTAEVRQTNAALEREIIGHKEAQRTLLRQREQLRALASQLSSAEQRERRRIAADLHDRIVQELGLSKIKLGRLQETLAQHPDRPLVDEISDLVEQAIQASRSLIFEVSPPILYDLGLESAIDWLAEQIQIQHGVTCSVDADGQAKPLGEDVRVALFQATRELLINVAKHAQAKTARIRVCRKDDDILVTVEDDGIGFVPSAGTAEKTGFGLFNIDERLGLLGGAMDIDSTPGRGTRVFLRAPLSDQEGTSHERG